MLEIRDLTRRFGATAAVDGITLSVPAGQMVGVIGRSGAGKSTLLRMVNRLQEPTSGSIRFGQTEVTALRGRALRDWRCGTGAAPARWCSRASTWCRAWTC